MDPLTLGIAGASTLASIFGSKKRGPSEYEKQQAAAAMQQRNLASQQQGYGTQAYGNYQGEDLQRKQAERSYVDYLQQDPNTDQRYAQDLTRLTAGVNTDTAAGNANVAATNARMGLSPESSFLSGSVGMNTTARASTLANARQAILAQQQAARQANLEKIFGIRTDATNNYGNEAQQWDAAAAGGFGNAGGQFGNLAQADDVRNAAYDAQQGANIGGWAGTLGSILPSIGTGRTKKPTVPGAGSNYTGMAGVRPFNTTLTRQF